MENRKSIFRPEYRMIVEWLSSKRQLNGVTQEQLAKRLSKPQSFVSKYENCERRIDVVEFLEICRALELDPKEMLQRFEEKF